MHKNAKENVTTDTLAGTSSQVYRPQLGRYIVLPTTSHKGLVHKVGKGRSNLVYSSL